MLKKLLTPKRVPQGETDLAALGNASIGATAARARHSNVSGLGSAPNRVLAEAEAHNAAGRFEAALALIDQAIDAAPNEPILHVERGSTLYEWGRFLEARQAFLLALRMGSKDVELQLKLGWTCVAAGLSDEAAPWMRKAADARPGSAKALFGLAIALQLAGHVDDAIENFEKVLVIDPAHYDALIQLGDCRMRKKDPLAAEALVRRAIELREDDPVGWTNLSAALSSQDRIAEVQQALETVDRLEKETGVHVDNFINHALLHSDDGRLTEALALYERNLAAHPSARAHFAYGTLLMRMGRLRDGWGHFEFRWMEAEHLSERAQYRKPVWNGQDLRERTILLRREQGFGDLIQFVRYAPLLKALGANVWLQVGPGIFDLARGFEGVDRVFRDGDEVRDFDYFIQVMSLPRVFGTDVESIPNRVPYVRASGDRVDKWARRLADDTRLRVGLVWAGHPNHYRDRHRSLRLNALKSLADVPGVRFVSMQKGSVASETAASDFVLDDMSGELNDFSDTAALVSHLDLVICVDTAVAHLAGAMGKRVWVMVPTPPDYRWLEGRDDSPWYPTMQLFRQTRRGEWSDVIARVAESLRREVANDGARDVSREAEATRAPTSVSCRATPWPPPVDRPPFTAMAETRIGIVQYRPEDTPIADSLRWYGEYLQLELNVLVKIIRPGATVVEAGADIGVHALALSRAIGDDGHLLLYESRSAHQNVLRQNIAANERRNVTIMRRSLNGRRELADAEGNASETIDELRLKSLDILKINRPVDPVTALGGAGDTLWRLRPVLYVSDADGQNLAAIAAAARDFGYRCFSVETPLFNPDNFSRRDENIFGGRTTFALFGFPEEREFAVPADSTVELS